MRANPLDIIRVIPWGCCPYADAIRRQEKLRDRVTQGLEQEAILVMEHPSIITRGRGDHGAQLRVSEAFLASRGIALMNVDRGGGATYHGPGQVVAYPVLRFSRFQRDIHRYLRILEGAVLRVCEDLGVSGRRRTGLSGVWVEDRKIAFIGVAVRGNVTSHGLSLNVHDVHEGFQWIDPCGIKDLEVTSLEQEGASIPTEEAASRLAEALRTVCQEATSWWPQDIPPG